ncbi:MAG: hypothetical protein HKN56_00170 [Gammaproteobacteria bacterium]|nr:hypothetical protein [Gammaproteobacteria bacterium]NND53370.1 hypothetical protein [Gammaproteobacteria bacterium]
MQRVFLRFFSYALVTFVIVVLMLSIADRVPGGLDFEHVVDGIEAPTSEFSPVEILQNLLLLISAGCFLLVAWIDRLRRPMAASIAALMLASLIRELDFFLDFYVVDNLWQALCVALVSAGIVYGMRNRQRFVQGWKRSWPSAGLALIMGGYILLIAFAQLVGHGPLWQAVLAENYLRVVKVAAEEFVELGAYIIIMIGTVEFLWAWSRLPRKRKRG